jgi:AraC family transcriptional regulator
MNLSLPYGKFIGKLRRETHVQGFSFTEVVDHTNEEVPRHTHEDAHFFLVVRGAYITSARNTASVCPPATLLFNPVGTTHRDRFYTRGGRFFTVSIRPENLNRVQDGVGLFDHAIGLRDGQASWLAARLYKEFKVMDKLSPLIMEGMALELLAHAARRETRPGKTPPAWLRLAYELIHDRCAEAVTVGEIAKTVGVHPFHLTRTFRKFFHCSPGEYLRRCRLRTASELLRHSQTSLAEIALQCGFSDQSQFTKSFKRNSGMTPGEFRRLFK